MRRIGFGNRVPNRDYGRIQRRLAAAAAKGLAIRASRAIVPYSSELARSYLKRKVSRGTPMDVDPPQRRRNETEGRTEPRKGRRARRYATTGRLRGRVYAKKKKDSNFYLHGAVVRREAGGRIRDNNAVYIGHCTYQHVDWIRTLWLSVLKTLFRKAGLEVRSFEAIMNEEVWNTYSVVIQYNSKPEESGSLTAITVSLSGTSTFVAAADNIINGLHGISDGNVVEFKEIQLITTANTQNVAVASINFDNVYVDIDSSSVMKVQNTTLATSGDTTNNDDVGDVENNPVTGYLYETKLWRNYIEPSVAQTSGTPTKVASVADRTSGVLSWTASTLGQLFRKPPVSKSTLGVHKMGRVLLQPGDIKYSKLRFKARMSFNKLILKIGFPLTSDNPLNARKTELGNAAVFGLERTLDSRVAEPEVRIAYQLDNVVKMKVSFGISKTVEFVTLMDAAITS